MAFAATMSTSEPRSFSIGTLKIQFFTYTATTADNSGTVTADRLTTLMHVFLDGKIQHTALPTYATNAATLAFTAPGGTIYGTGFCVGV